MSLSRKEVNHIAQLARLALTGEEKERYREQLSDILDHVAQLQELDTSQISPTSSILPPRSRLREDEITPCLDIEDALRNAPQTQEDQFRVPPVLE